MSILYVGQSAEAFKSKASQNNKAVFTAGNALEALNIMKSNLNIAVIICEYNLPGNSGMYFFDRLQDNSIFKDIPFILLSNEFNPKLYQEAFSKGVKDYYVSSSTPFEHIIKRAETLCGSGCKETQTHREETAKMRYKLPWSKRLFDIVFASLVLIVLSPFLLVIMLAIRLESKGKTYYIAKRVGRKTFDFYKLRSMKQGSDALIKNLAQSNNQYKKDDEDLKIDFDSTCPKCAKLETGKTCSTVLYIDNHEICDYWYNEQKKAVEAKNSKFIKILNDPRVTRVGKFIRNTSIDELPQLINVLKGDMSIVGNRPLPVYEAELLTKDTMSKRFLAPAGITGLWQVELRGRGGDMSEEERMRLDNQYADHFVGDNYSFWYDVKLILRTIPSLIQKSSV